MKRQILGFCVILTLTAVTGCGGDGNDNVRAFGEKFAGYVNSGQTDSIRAVYAGADFDSIAPLPTDSISISEIEKGLYKINYANGQWIEVKDNGENGPIVVKSKGIAAFPQNKYEMALKTGMLNDTISDLEAKELLKNEQYFDWLNKNFNNDFKIKVTPGKFREIWKDQWGEAWKGTMTITVTNLSDTPISGSDYSISYKSYDSNGFTDETQRNYTTNNTVKGIDLGANDSGTISLSRWLSSKFFDFKILPAKGKEAVLSYEFTPTGNEYQEYQEKFKDTQKDSEGYDWLSKRKATPNDMRGKDPYELRIMRNWIYARHGYIFKSEDLQEYFSQFPWYNPTSSDVSSKLNKIEKANVQFIKRYE